MTLWSTRKERHKAQRDRIGAAKKIINRKKRLRRKNKSKNKKNKF